MCWYFQRLTLEGAEPRGEFLRAGNGALEFYLSLRNAP